jgi:hypothetical protein
MLNRIDLLTYDGPVVSPDGVVYSTGPRTGTTESGLKYYVKGPEPEISFAELAGCLLARAVGLSVASVAVCAVDQHVLAASEGVADIGRDARPWLRNPPGLVTNFPELYSAIVVDAWLANTDRNLGNVVVASTGTAKVRFVMIDYEKSAALRPSPLITTTSLNHRQFWPTGELGQTLRRTKPFLPPMTMVSSIQAFVSVEQNVAAIITSVRAHVTAAKWSDDCANAVIHRGQRIATIAEEVWNLS